jgi:hypothetical protein
MNKENKIEGICEFVSDGQKHSCIDGCHGTVENCMKCHKDICSNVNCPLGKGIKIRPKKIEEMEERIENFLKHLSKWNYYSASEELDEIIAQARKEERSLIKEKVEKMKEIPDCNEVDSLDAENKKLDKILALLSQDN